MLKFKIREARYLKALLYMFAVRKGRGGGVTSFTHHLAYECTLVEGQQAAQKLGTLIRFVVDLMCHVSVNTQKDHDMWWKHKEAEF